MKVGGISGEVPSRIFKYNLIHNLFSACIVKESQSHPSKTLAFRLQSCSLKARAGPV